MDCYGICIFLTISNEDVLQKVRNVLRHKKMSLETKETVLSSYVISNFLPSINTSKKHTRELRYLKDSLETQEKTAI